MFRVRETAGGVHARPDGEPQGLGGEALGGRPGDFREGIEAPAQAFLHLGEPLGDDAPVLIEEWGHIHHGAQRRKIDECGVIEGTVHGLVEDIEEAVGDADGSQFIERIGRVGAFGVHRRDRRRELIRDGVVVEDDNVEAELVRVGDFDDRRDAAVGSDEEVHAHLPQLLHGAEVQAVAFGEAIRDVVDAIRAERFQPLIEDGDGGDTVDIEVAVESDGLVSFRLPGGRG